MHGTLRFLYLCHILYGICVKIFIMNRYISKSYTTSKNTILTDNIQNGAALVSTITSSSEDLKQNLVIALWFNCLS